jgi:hypothetical protein
MKCPIEGDDSEYSALTQGSRYTETGRPQMSILMHLQALQLRLQTIYEIDTEYDVEEFVISDIMLAQRLENSSTARHIPEKLLVRQHSEGLDISLFLDKEVLKNLHLDNPTQALHPGNLADFCTVTEGISHFVYLIWNAQHDRSISLFELELQAEVDKYVMAAALLAEQLGGTLPHNLPHILFDKPSFDTQLNRNEHRRYRLANAYARQYCHSLHRSLLEIGDSVLITREIRQFYRLLNQKKIQRINRLPPHH